MRDAHPSLPELFDLDYGGFEDDFSFYENLARRCERPILELGAGTGRAALPLARAGFEVWGIEISEAMLDRALLKAGASPPARLHLLPGDMRDFQLEQAFDLIFAGLGAFHHLITADDQRACLRCVERHLAPGGLFVCDLRSLLHSDWEPGDSVPLLHDWTRALPATGETVTKLRSVRVDRAQQVQHETHLYDCLAADGSVHRVVSEVDLRFTTRYEMEGLLREAGLQLGQVYGDFDLTPWDEYSEYLITVAWKPPKEST